MCRAWGRTTIFKAPECRLVPGAPGTVRFQENVRQHIGKDIEALRPPRLWVESGPRTVWEGPMA